MTENTLRNKTLYKIFIIILKYVPSILALIQICILIFSYFGKAAFGLTCIGGSSLTLLVLLYIMSFVFRFCGLYRLSLNYVTLMNILTVFDYYIGIPVNNEILYKLFGIISGVFVLLWIYVFYKNRKNPKIDHIKQLCENYSACCK